MNRQLSIVQAGPAMSLQDLGRPGYRALGLTTGGAADRRAIYEGAALLGQSPSLAAIEMPGQGGSFRATADIRIALTGASMAATLDDAPLIWNASHLMPAGSTLTIGGARAGSYGYLHVGGGVDAPVVMGGRGSHLAGGIGGLLATGTVLELGADKGSSVGMTLGPDARFGGGPLRCVASMQTGSFSDETLERFTQTTFRRDIRANRMGIRMDFDGAGFNTDDQLSIVSEVVVPGDIQISGDGAPYVLMYECQTTGGYPRIGSVLPCDLPRAAQAPTGAAITFEFLSLEDAATVQARAVAELEALPSRVVALRRDPLDIPVSDMLGLQLISGAVSATANPFEEGT